MRLFWLAYRDWLAARGFYLHALHNFEYTYEETWCPPPFTCAAPLPYAERDAHDATGKRVPIRYNVSSAPFDGCSCHLTYPQVQMCSGSRQPWPRRHHQVGQYVHTRVWHIPGPPAMRRAVRTGLPGCSPSCGDLGYPIPILVYCHAYVSGIVARKIPADRPLVAGETSILWATSRRSDRLCGGCTAR